MSLENTPITQEEIHTLKHTLGLNDGRKRHKEPYRNYYNTRNGDATLDSLCERGFMARADEANYYVTQDGIGFLENILGLSFLFEPKTDAWRNLSPDEREGMTAERSGTYCPHCYATDNDTSFVEDVAAEFDYLDAVYNPDGNATLEFDRRCEGCGKRYHLSVDATVKMYFTTTCETEDDEPTEDDMMREAMIGVY